ncbi:MAG: hypothetical protein IH931_02915 [candidate division Zixibacteria bacterium]|nr:hypothetical protein [candidate division Zixibacteria bacterium]
MKTYLATFEFISGEYGQMFMQVFAARNEREVEKKIQHYLKTYYGDYEAGCENDTWFYYGGEVAVKNHGFQEIKNPMDVIERLRA